MGKKEVLQKKYEKLLSEYEKGHKKLDEIKAQMVAIRVEIKAAPSLSEERLDEILMKS